MFSGTTRYEGNHSKLNLSRFRQRKFCISILFLRNPKNRLTHRLIEFYNSLNRLYFGDVEKQCCDAGQEAAICGVSVLISLNLDRTSVVFVFVFG